MIILVDMDDVLADFDGGFIASWSKMHPDKDIVDIKKRDSFYIAEVYPKKWIGFVNEILTLPNFYLSLPVIAGSLDALAEMRDLGHEVFICTAPFSEYENCVLEKYKWIDKNLGREWTNKIVLTRDKTIVAGDYLIDDKPEIIGFGVPAWEHIIYTRSYNKHIKNKKRLTWKEDWKKILGI